jgi:hypothetical protein
MQQLDLQKLSQTELFAPIKQTYDIGVFWVKQEIFFLLLIRQIYAALLNSRTSLWVTLLTWLPILGRRLLTKGHRPLVMFPQL